MAFWYWGGGSLLTETPFIQKAITEEKKTLPEGHNRRSHQKAITEDHFQAEGHLQSEGHQTRRSYQATPLPHTHRWLLLWTVHILLECILFYDLFLQGRGAWPGSATGRDPPLVEVLISEGGMVRFIDFTLH